MKAPASPKADVHLPAIELLSAPSWSDYALLDSGNGLKLERFGAYTVARPEPEAIWSPALPEKTWRSAQAVFQPAPEENGGHWDARTPLPERWPMTYKGLRFWAMTTNSRHLGVFPEQAAHWDWTRDLIERTAGMHAASPIKVLNLFGYTGLASLVAAQAGAQVTHVDAAKKAIAWARDNQVASGLGEKPIRWLVDDAIKFVQREGRRGAQYDGLILDPPKFGRGPKGEVWEFYKAISALLRDCRAILAPQPLFVVLTAYAIKASSLTAYYAMQEMMSGLGGQVTAGELVTVEQSAGRVISNAIFARWQAK